ncbi:extracellular solute-binding protein [Paenibacillus chitinolyticus]|uniref:extracellular solute-binding protein n=1 Tax=Paenibacillus chitinolyticus TaxID=79263 RepID=UPI0036D9BDF2
MKRKRAMKLVLACALTTAVLSGCSSGGGKGAGEGAEAKGVNATGFPIVQEPVTVNAFAAKFFANADWNKLKLWQEYEKKTNIHINWETVQKDALKEKRNLLMASSGYPDLFYASAFSKSDLFKYGKQGVFLPLNEYIDQYAPNLKALMEKYPVIKKGITMPDGKIYSLPTLYDPEFRSVFFNTPWVKTEWLTKLGLKEPENLDEFAAMLKAFKKGDPNGNGKPDEIAWGGVGTTGLVGYLRGAYGLGNHGNANPYVDTEPGSDKIRFIPADPRYKEMLEYIHKLYKDGLLEQDIASVKSEEIDAKGTAGLLGIVDNVDPAAIYNQKGYAGLPVLKGPHGDQLYTYIGSPLGNIGMFILTDKAKNPAAMVRWMDYFYGEEGIKMFFMGWKDDTYKEESDGTVDYVDAIKNNKDGLSLDQAVSQYLIWPGGYYPGFVKQAYFKGAEGLPTSAANSKKADPHVLKPDQIWPAFNFTSEEQQELTTLANDIETYVTEMRDKFIVGDAPLSQWDDYVATLNKMGLDRYKQIYQAALDRYSKSS